MSPSGLPQGAAAGDTATAEVLVTWKCGSLGGWGFGDLLQKDFVSGWQELPEGSGDENRGGCGPLHSHSLHQLVCSVWGVHSER